MTNKEKFFEWWKDGNVILFTNGYSTQCHQWKNRINGIVDLYRFFLREFIYI